AAGKNDLGSPPPPARPQLSISMSAPCIYRASIQSNLRFVSPPVSTPPHRCSLSSYDPPTNCKSAIAGEIRIWQRTAPAPGGSMSRLKLTVATTDYDHFRDFRLGLVNAEGIDVTWLTLGHHEVFARFTFNREWEVSE